MLHCGCCCDNMMDFTWIYSENVVLILIVMYVGTLNTDLNFFVWCGEMFQNLVVIVC
ncbi:hypothetical protein RchiOBHm_Chr5g0001101 [Rosa chinensis]|uniref:Uncharacterized protein n=1 Tax=Rosa chinensis TaxID=74649 RepID=A0A2P6Q261_ROSCH|nr:hypothetical protein RchiOBHm_Chr5g0001101 [Rosa chinensis]